MQASINPYKPNEEFYISEDCYITELSNSDKDADVSIARARVKIGVTTQWHRLTTITERYVILSGKACVEVGSLAPCDVTVGDVVIIPPMVAQRIRNTGDEELIFLAICSPRFVTEAYQNIETEY